MSARAGSAAAGRCSTTRASRSGSTSRSSADTHRFEFDVRHRRQPDPVLRSGRARRRHAAPQSHLGESRLRSVAAGDLGRQRHRAGRPIPRPTPMSATSSAACRMRTTCPPGTHSAQGGALGPAASRPPHDKAAVHADTPTVAHADSLGRTFLTVAHNKFKCSDTPPADPPIEEFHRTRVDLRHRRQPARSHRRQGPRRHALRLRHARQPHPPGQHGGGRALDAERRGGQADPRLGQPGSPVPHRLRSAAAADGILPAGRRRCRSCWSGAPSMARAGPTRRPTTCAARSVQLFDQAGVVTSDDYDFKGNLLRSQPPACRRSTRRRSTGRPPCRWKPRSTPAAPATTRSTARRS